MELDTKSLAEAARADALRMVHSAKSSHIGSSLSAIDILSVIYGRVAHVGPDLIDSPERDIVIVSKGHAAAGTYAVMSNAGIIPRDWLSRYGADGAPLGGHVTSHGVPGVELSTGSLGHGLPFGIGLALAAKRQGTDRRVYVVMSDGECDEGTTWESALIAAHHGLDNLTVAVDRNGLQSLTTTEETLKLEPFADKWRTFGWTADEVDGHDHETLEATLSARTVGPHIVICKTTKGKGVSFMEGQVPWHYKSPNDEQLAAALEEVVSA